MTEQSQNPGSSASRRINAIPQRIDHPRPPAKIVKRTCEPLWIQRGWQRRKNEYAGFYRTHYGSYQGKIICRYLGKIQFYVFNPPECLKGHPHVTCFIPRGGGKYEVHFSRRGGTIDDGILAIEQILIDAHERNLARGN